MGVLLHQIIALIKDAGKAVMEIYTTDFDVEIKRDNSPVTTADKAAEAIIIKGLQALTPDIAIISEEAAEAGQLPVKGTKDRFWLVDPVDGTREFINRNGEFTLNIALIEQGSPVLGVVFAPAVDALYYGDRDGACCEIKGIVKTLKPRHPPQDGVVVIASRSHGNQQEMDHFLAGRKVAALRVSGSSLKFCRVAAGEADLYPRFTPTREWDTAAGHAVLAAAGGRVADFGGAPLIYGKPGYRNPYFLAKGIG